MNWETVIVAIIGAATTAAVALVPMFVKRRDERKAAVAANLFLLSPKMHAWFDLSKADRAVALICVMMSLGYLMVCRLKFPSLKMLHVKIPSFHLAFLSVVTAVFVLYGILYFFPLILALVIWSYIGISLVLSFIRLIAGKKSKTLEEFEPEPDDEDK